MGDLHSRNSELKEIVVGSEMARREAPPPPPQSPSGETQGLAKKMYFPFGTSSPMKRAINSLETLGCSSQLVLARSADVFNSVEKK